MLHHPSQRQTGRAATGSAETVRPGPLPLVSAFGVEYLRKPISGAGWSGRTSESQQSLPSAPPSPLRGPHSHRTWARKRRDRISAGKNARPTDYACVWARERTRTSAETRSEERACPRWRHASPTQGPCSTPHSTYHTRSPARLASPPPARRLPSLGFLDLSGTLLPSFSTGLEDFPLFSLETPEARDRENGVKGWLVMRYLPQGGRLRPSGQGSQNNTYDGKWTPSLGRRGGTAFPSVRAALPRLGLSPSPGDEAARGLDFPVCSSVRRWGNCSFQYHPSQVP